MERIIVGAETGIRLQPLGESAILVEFGQEIRPEIHRKVKTFTAYLEQHPFPGMIEYVAAFASVTVYYDPIQAKSQEIIHGGDSGPSVCQMIAARLQEMVSKLDYAAEDTPRIVEIPVCYGGEMGPDLAYVAEHNGLTAAEVIEIHSGGEYLVYMLGFAPGFPYLGGMSERIATPRRQSPRMSIPAGSVGIAGMQTGVYPIATPGGWQLIGRTPLALFRPGTNPPTLLQAGDVIKFRAISCREYEDYLRQGERL
ncbi:allophanate hydrolase subunit 1 [Lucifera butyrica]|uniref:Allophanate hydrolase subunit 1 n=1 Tax=Lucifera butyrica TaxID=1351585 RepID=A0A498RE76_9FIRM|nr:5-oxoprolinase subunit PxpB [Lucifera butyrica]VBB09804.1 allophanate hydrolase subunit 1 [Lucifera butyrica]